MLNDAQMPLFTREHIQAEFISLLKSIFQDQDHTKINILIERTKIWETILSHDEYSAIATEGFTSYIEQGRDLSLLLWLLGALRLHSLFEKAMDVAKQSEAKEIDLDFTPQDTTTLCGEISLAAVIANLPPGQAIYLESLLKMKGMYLSCLNVTHFSAFYLFKYAIFCNKPDVIRLIKNYESLMNQSLLTEDGYQTPFEIALNSAYVIPEYTPMPFMTLVAFCKVPDFNRVISSVLKVQMAPVVQNNLIAQHNPSALDVFTVELWLINTKSSLDNFAKTDNTYFPTLLWLLAKREKWEELLVIIKKFKKLIFNTAYHEGDDHFRTIALLASAKQQWQIVEFILDAYYAALCENERSKPNNERFKPYGEMEIDAIFYAALNFKQTSILVKILTYFPETRINKLMNFIDAAYQTNESNPTLAKLLALHSPVIKIFPKKLSPAFLTSYNTNKNSVLMTMKQVIRTFFSQDSDSKLLGLPEELRELMAVHALKMLDPELALFDQHVLIVQLRNYYKTHIPMYDRDFIVNLCLAERYRLTQIKFKIKLDILKASYCISEVLANLPYDKLLHDKPYRDKVVQIIASVPMNLSPEGYSDFINRCNEMLQNCKDNDGIPLLQLEMEKSETSKEQTAEAKEENSDANDGIGDELDNYNDDGVDKKRMYNK